MSLKTCLLAFFTILCFQSLAQDKIYKNDGSIINAKVKTVSTATIIYKRFDNPDGPEYTILKKDVSQIKYENGTTDNFTGAETKGDRRGYTKGGSKKGKYVKKYGDNIISVIPGAYTVSPDGTINDVGVGICYERQLDERGHISFNLPVMISFSSSKDFSNLTYNYYYSGTPATYGNYNSYYFMPGVKFYPAASNQRVRYSLGASFFAIFGSEPYEVYDNNNQTSSYNGGNWNYAVYGFMISNSINVSINKSLFMAIDLGAGIPISDNRHADNDGGLDVIAGPWIQFGIKVGYRF